MMTHCLYVLGLQVILLAISQLADGANSKDMEVVYKWTLFDYLWPSKEARREAIKNGKYIPENVPAFEVNMYKSRFFITTPRPKPGVPAVVSTISNVTRNGQYLLKPFPDWKSNREGNCNGLTSVFHTIIDEFGRLWALDSGCVNFANGQPERICTPQILVFDLNSGDRLVARYRIPDSVLDCNSLLFDMQIDVRNGDYESAFIYINDVLAHHIIVFDLRHKKFHRITHSTFLPNPKYGDYIVAGTRIFLTDGLYSLTLGPVCDNDRRVYYHALASLEECYVMASTIRDKTFETNDRAFPDSFFCYSKKRASQSGPEVMTEDGIMFYEQETLNAIACWNTETDYNMENNAIVARNDTTMQDIRGLKLVGKKLYAMASRLQLYIYNLLSRKEYNFYVLRASVDEIIRGSSCAKPCPRKKHI